MKFLRTTIPGAFLIETNRFLDDRGGFVKTFHHGEFALNGLSFAPAEEFYSMSHRGVLRGMHFQTPPAAHDKLVCCIKGNILDVLLDLRKGSPAFGKFETFELGESIPRNLFVPKGVAHGFLSLAEGSLVMYSVTTVHDPLCDSGIRWDSFGMEWPCPTPILSNRDKSFAPLSEFDSPFLYSA